MRNKAQGITKKLVPYEVRLGEVGSHRTYFQALFSKVDQTPQVLNAYEMAQKVFDLDKGKYFPHISLAYGDFSDEQVDNLKRIAEQEFETKNISFLARDIELWHTEGVVGEWHQIATFLFGKS